MSYPLVSVIIPTFNRTDYLKLTLESVMNQTFTNFEIIVVDDGSNSTENERLCSQFGKIKYIKIINSGGPAKPRNQGLFLAKGEFIAFVDDDDLWHPEKLKVQVDILENNSNYGLVHSYCEVIDEYGVKINEVIGRPGNSRVKHGNVKLRMMGNWTLMTPTPMLRKSLVKQVGLFNETMPAAGEDREYWTRCSFYTNFYYVDKPLAYYRKHSNNISLDNVKYLNLPIFLKSALDKVCLKVNISKGDYHILLNNIIYMQSKMIKKDIIKTIKNLFKLNKFWFFNLRTNKIIIKSFIK
ncbi:glycosyltransferase family 2 protein [Winogradskyella wichelsiae]|uniref:glycosyltransferase family 2 protein n=1 Tax=Winogradskyella wichelsiae TaxID=2697007 RepID=UPI0015C700C8|nr:glycosyltransferase family A protein [Winogradskyella wichelsiae]